MEEEDEEESKVRDIQGLLERLQATRHYHHLLTSTGLHGVGASAGCLYTHCISPGSTVSVPNL